MGIGSRWVGLIDLITTLAGEVQVAPITYSPSHIFLVFCAQHFLGAGKNSLGLKFLVAR